MQLVKDNDLTGVEDFFKRMKGKYVPGKRVVNQAVHNGNILILQYLLNNGARLRPCAINIAIKQEQVVCLDFIIYSLHHRYIPYEVIDKAIAAGKLYLIEHLRVQFGCQFESDCIHIAADKGNLDAVKFLYSLYINGESELIFGRSTANIAACSGHLEVLLFIVDKLKELDETVDFYTIVLLQHQHHESAMKFLNMYPEFRTTDIVRNLCCQMPPPEPPARKLNNADVEPRKLHFIKQAINDLGCLFGADSIEVALDNDYSLIFEYLYSHPLIKEQKDNFQLIRSYNLRNNTRCHGMKCIKYLFSTGFFQAKPNFLSVAFTKNLCTRIIDMDDVVWRKLLYLDLEDCITELYPEPWSMIQRLVFNKKRQLAVQEHCSYNCLIRHLPRDVIMYCVNIYL